MQDLEIQLGPLLSFPIKKLPQLFCVKVLRKTGVLFLDSSKTSTSNK